MSRYTLPSKQQDIVTAVGFDRPMETFFAIVTREREDGENDVLLWLGGTAREVMRAEDMVEPLKPYADLDAEMLAKLRRDRAEAPVPTSLQRWGATLGQGGREP